MLLSLGYHRDFHSENVFHYLSLDWELIGDYLGLFDLQEKLPELQHTYGATPTN